MASQNSGRFPITSENAPSNPNTSTTVNLNTHRDRAVSTTEPSIMRSPPSNQASHQSSRPDDKMLEHFGVFGGDDFAAAFFFWLSLAFGVTITAFFYLPLLWIATACTGLFTFVLFRHVAVKAERYTAGRGWVRRPDLASPAPDISKLPSIYFLYVLGSGGHTAEMIETIKHKFRGNEKQHRRYIVTTGDESSPNMVRNLETNILDAYPDGRGGTFDVFQITRARAVHQSKLTAPFTCLMTAAHAINALTREPISRPAREFGSEYKYPHVIVTNGPATGFIIGLVAHLLKIFCLVPPNRLKTVYIESWARSRTLSLTGKLFRWTSIANVFCVQHQTLARTIAGAEYVGGVAARVTPLG